MDTLFATAAVLMATALCWASGVVPDKGAIEVSLLTAVIVLYVDMTWAPRLPPGFQS